MRQLASAPAVDGNQTGLVRARVSLLDPGSLFLLHSGGVGRALDRLGIGLRQVRIEGGKRDAFPDQLFNSPHITGAGIGPACDELCGTDVDASV